MKTFLEYVAEDILSKWGTDLSRLTVVFPNKRASLFLNEHLVRLAGKPIWSPAYTTISDLFRHYSRRQVADPIKLVCELHKSFTEQTGIEETLDHFFGWGQLLLADFDDIDKQMADADKVLANITDLHEMDDSSFLTDEQREALHRFFSNFTNEHNSELRERFLRLWSKLKAIYHDFNDRLAAQGLAYEGALYREVVVPSCFPPKWEVAAPEDSTREASPSGGGLEGAFPFEGRHEGVFLFVGFNVLLKVEQRLFSILKDAGKARFYWDFDDYYMPHPSHLTPHSTLNTHEAGYFISQYLADFPNELDSSDERIYHNFCHDKQINIISASTENIQARYAAKWLRTDEKRIDDGHHTAIVLCNEGLLPTIIHCLPPEVAAVNITSGYPLAQAPVTALVNLLIALRRDGYDRKHGTFRLRQVRALLRHPYIVSATPQATALVRQLTEEKNFRPTPQQLAVDTLTAILFRPLQPLYQNEEMLTWLCEVVQHIASTMPPVGISVQNGLLSPLKEETIFRTYTLLNRLLNLVQGDDLQTDITTLNRLITQLMQTTTVPFHGEPVEGLQVMGLLETRNLDFQHLLILSAQEGNMPRGANDTSFIPYSLRRAYGLTTPEHKVAIYSYYFHRLLQRAKDVTIVYNNSTSEGQKGEMSRFLLQLMVEYPQKRRNIHLMTLQGHISHQLREPQPVENRAILPKLLTPTAINLYLRCPLQFHYYYVCGLRELDDPEGDTIDNRLFGNIFHEAARSLYSNLMERDSRIVKDDIDQLLKTAATIERAVDDAFRKEIFASHHSTNTAPLALGGLALINRQVIIHYLRQLLTLDRQLTPFTILSLEGDVSMKLGDAVIGGRIDRLDMVTDDKGEKRIRVIDYKTSAHRMKSLADVDAVFSQEALKEHSDYYLQAMLYSLIVARQHPQTPVAPALLFIQHAATENYDPILKFGNTPVNNISDYAPRFTELLQTTITQMFDHSQPLEPTADKQRCRYCPYRQLCQYVSTSTP